MRNAFKIAQTLLVAALYAFLLTSGVMSVSRAPIAQTVLCGPRVQPAGFLGSELGMGMLLRKLIR
jgi:hypothetical protein